MRLAQTIFALAAFVLLFPSFAAAQSVGSAPAGFEADPRLGAPVDRVCFRHSLRSFGETTNQTVVVGFSRDRHFLVATRDSCPGLAGAEGIAFRQYSVCLRRGDFLFADDGLAFNRPASAREARRCRIESVHTWDLDAQPPAAPSADR